MPSTPLQQHYFDLLAQHVRGDRYPSHRLLSRMETAIFTSDQLEEYIAILLEKLQADHYPSQQLLDRLERMLVISAAVA
jgi:hypothetical protein